MRILLLGEFSGFFKNLAIGLRNLGHEVDWFSDGDGYKKISGQTGVLRTSNSKYGTIIEPLLTRKRFQGYDIVQLVDADLWNPWISAFMFQSLLKLNKKVFVCIAGQNTKVQFDWYKKHNLMNLCPLADDPKRYSKSIRARMEKISNDYIYSRSAGVIPISYEYSLWPDGLKNKSGIILLPISLEDIPYTPNIVHGKIVFFHGLNREVSKGTKYIREAMNIVKEKYPDDVEIILDGHMPLDQYLKVMERTNVVIDQCKGFSWGMNACYAMAQGKIVMAPGRNECLSAYGLESSPIWQIGPDVDLIVNQMEKVIQNKNNIEAYGMESRKFAEKFHDCNKVAQQYIDYWNVSKTDGKL